MRTLYHVPLIHSPAELGSLKDTFLEQHIRAHGNDATQVFVQSVQAYWQEVLRRLEEHGFFQAETAKDLHVFVDSMPDTTEAMKHNILNALAAKDLPLYSIVKKIRDCGAHVHGTEGMGLLLREWACWQQYVETGRAPDPKEQAALLRLRDTYIAQRIDASLPQDGTGLLFLGQLHDIRGALERQSICCNVVDL